MTIPTSHKACPRRWFATGLACKLIVTMAAMAALRVEPWRLRVFPGTPAGATIDPHGDHRIAMSFAVAGLVADGETAAIGRPGGHQRRQAEMSVTRIARAPRS